MESSRRSAPPPPAMRSGGGAWSQGGYTLPRVIPWIIIAVVAVPLVVIAFIGHAPHHGCERASRE